MEEHCIASASGPAFLVVFLISTSIFYMHLSLVSPSAPSVEYVGTEGQVWLAQQGLISRLILQGQQDGSAEKGSCWQPNLTM